MVAGASRSLAVTGVVLQDRKIAHCPFHMLTPAEREVFVARKRLLEYMGFQLRRAVFAKESQWDPKVLNQSKRGGWQRARGPVVRSLAPGLFAEAVGDAPGWDQRGQLRPPPQRSARVTEGVGTRAGNRGPGLPCQWARLPGARGHPL